MLVFQVLIEQISEPRQRFDLVQPDLSIYSPGLVVAYIGRFKAGYTGQIAQLGVVFEPAAMVNKDGHLLKEWGCFFQCLGADDPVA